jgi:hypothetical protein
MTDMRAKWVWTAGHMNSAPKAARRGHVLEDLSLAQDPRSGMKQHDRALSWMGPTMYLPCMTVMLIHWFVMGRGAVNIPRSSRRSLMR